MKTEKLLITLIVSVLVILGIIGGLRYVPDNFLPQFLSGKQSLYSETTCSECKQENKKEENRSLKSPVISITDAQQIEKIKNLKTPVVIKFYTDSCPACIQSTYPYQFVAAMLSEKVTFYEVNLNQQEIAEQIETLFEFNVQHIPTFVFLSEGKLKDKPQSGFQGQDWLKNLIAKTFGIEE